MNREIIALGETSINTTSGKVYIGTKDFYEFTSPRLDIAKSTKSSARQHTVNFKTEDESINFFNSLQTKFYKFINVCIKRDMEIPWKYAPWLGDYTHPWTDEDLYKYFELTNDEIKIIETNKKKQNQDGKKRR